MIHSVEELDPEALLVTGDISEAEDVVFQLNRLTESIQKQIFFVLGNHDFYQSSIAKTRRSVIDAARENGLFHYLTDCQPVSLSDSVELVGEDGWGDATQGDYDQSPIRLNDFARIEDFYLHEPSRWKALLKEQGGFSAKRLQQKLDAVSSETKQILVATHVPPFCESCWYEGRTTDDNWAPFFVCGQVGDVLLEYARQHPDQQLTVLCGHTHHGGIANMRDNLVVHTGAAIYGQPSVEGLIEVSENTVSVDSV